MTSKRELENRLEDLRETGDVEDLPLATIARNVAADYLIKYQRTGDVRFGQRFESICEKFNIAPSEETEHNHRHAHAHKHDHDRELTERQQAALDNITGGYEPGEVEGEAVVSDEESGDGESDEGDTFEIGW